MKKILLLVALAIGFAVNAQEKLNEGVLVSKQILSSENEQVQQQLAMMGDMVSETYFKDSKSRVEMSNPMTGDITTISNGETNEVLVLMDNPMAGKMYSLKKAEPSKEDLDNITVEKGTETKTILDYKCQQYFVKIKQGETMMEMEVFTTDAIDAYSKETAMFEGKLQGFPLYTSIDMNQNGVEMTVVSEVIAIRKEDVPEDKFVMLPPEGYTKME
ncbi:hypothetical protein [Lacinutrix sp. Hel_I_90]|uniref:hypothetical protein n=1 Tax=Lacinutrix sp. Hel_I_90 TaxID=1249999 RepID=UPI0005C883BF|nr:hypothetical protein [Lacinutrix sp. Hel_I_90]